MKNVGVVTAVFAVISVAVISVALAALPCNSRLRIRYPHLFKHCENICTYGEWSSWKIVDKAQSENCESKKAYVKTRYRHAFTKTQRNTCPSQNETKFTCQPTMKEKARLFVKALDLGVNSSFMFHQWNRRSSTYTMPPYKFQKKRRQMTMEHCPTDDHKICKSNNRKRKNALAEFFDYKPQIIDNSITPEPYNFTKQMDTLNIHHRRRRENNICEDRYLLFMLDTSGSIGNSTFINVVSNLSTLVFYFCGNTKVAAITFGSCTYHEFCFKCDVNDQSDPWKLQEAIQRIRYHGGLTYTGEAFDSVCKNILTIPCGLPNRKDYTKCPAPIDVVVITDGKSNGILKACEEAKCLHNHAFFDINTFSIGVGNYDLAELNCIEDLDSDDVGHIFFDLDNFDEIGELIAEVEEYLSTPLNSAGTLFPYCYDLNIPFNFTSNSTSNYTGTN